MRIPFFWFLSSRAALFLPLMAALLPAAGCKDGKKASSGPVTITYWEKWTGFEGEAIRAVVDAFNARQAGVHVRLMTVSEIQKKLLVATAGGDPPDLSGLYSRNVQVYADRGALAPLDEGIAQHGLRLDDFLPVYLKECRLRGKTYALPIAPMTLALHYNRAHFREAGLDPDRPPRNFRELEAYSDKLTLRNPDGSFRRLGFLPIEPGWWNWSWIYWLGGSLYDYETKSITAYTPENVRALKWFYDFSGRHGVHRLMSFRGGFGNFASPQNAFLAGKVSMILQGVWMHAFIKTFNPGLDWAAAPFPAYGDLKDVTLIESDVLVVPKGSPNPEAAMKFIAFAVSPEGQEILHLRQMKFPVLKKMPESFWKKHDHPYIQVFRRLAESPNAFTAPRIGVFEEYFDEATAAFDLVWLHEKTPEEALAQLQRRMEKKWARELRRLERLGLEPE